MNLNARQREVVLAEDPRVFCVASPGSGKTRTLVEAVARAARTVQPDRVLAITFTRYAAAEMRRRLDGLLSATTARAITVGTFHAVAHDLLIAHWRQALLGFASANIVVYDRVERRALIKETLEQSRHRCPYGRVVDALEYLGTHGEPDPNPEQEIANQVMAMYLRALRDHTAVDYDTVLWLVHNLLLAHPEVSRWSHVFVDEGQDLSTLQHKLLDALRPDKLLMVADPDQLIYGWRGADLHLLHKAAANARRLVLEENYRSTPEIIAGSNRLIAHNKARLDKSMVTCRAASGKPILLLGSSEALAEIFVDHHPNSIGNNVGSIEAMLARTRLDLEQWSGRLMAKEIPHHLLGRRERLLERDDFKTVIAMMAFPDLPSNPMVLGRVCRALGLKDADIDLIRYGARDAGLTYYEAAVGRLETLRGFYADLQDGGIMERLALTLERLRRLTGGLLREEEAELIAQMTAYVRLEAWSKRSPGRFVSWLNLRDGQDEIVMRPGLHLMTVHAAKGLEFDRVYLVGLDDRTMPLIRAHNDHDALEEERRIMFVAMTRARDELILVRPDGGHSVNRWDVSPPQLSRFVNECLPSPSPTNPCHA